MTRDTGARLPLRRKLFFSTLVVAGVGVVATLGLFGADLYAHARTQDVAGMNIWGYRGAPLGAKQAGETRVAVLGGSTAFGWGLPAHEAIAAMLERRLLADARANRRRISVANLGAPGQGAYAFRFDLEDFAYLDYDIVVLYEGYNDVGLGEVANRGVPNYLLWRRQSPVFRLTGYFPVLPIIVREKSMAMLHGGDLEGAYEGKPVVFRPGLAARATAQTLNAAAKLSDSVAAQLGRLSDAPPTPAVDEQCTPRWKQYCGAVREAVAWALARDKRVVFVTQPYASDSHVEQQANAVKMLDARFAGDRRLQIVNLGHAIDLRDPRIAYDGLHLVAAGNDVIAAHLVDPVFEADAVSGARQ